MLSLQIPLLLSIGEEDNALTKATDSGDSDLVYLVLFHMWQKVCVDEIYMIAVFCRREIFLGRDEIS